VDTPGRACYHIGPSEAGKTQRDRLTAMFTGIVQHVGRVVGIVRRGEARVLTVDAGPPAAQVAIGDSVSVNGACLTAVRIEGERVSFDVGAETVRLTTLGHVREGDPVNLELSLRVGDRLGGHFVSGHVDGVGTVRRLTEMPGEVRLEVEVAPGLTDQMIPKGSVAVEGISLTIAALRRGAFEVSVIPHTLAATTLAARRPGDAVNIECDMIGRWVRKLVQGAGEGTGPTLSRHDLEEQGF